MKAHVVPSTRLMNLEIDDYRIVKHDRNRWKVQYGFWIFWKSCAEFKTKREAENYVIQKNGVPE